MNKLGFGFLRLPMKGDEVDLEATNALTDAYMSRGVGYFDTAYTYLDGKSELAIRESVVKRYPREQFRIADKLPSYFVYSREDCTRYFSQMLERCGVEYLDVFLLHWMNDRHYGMAKNADMFGFLAQVKAEGRAKKVGFSFHDTPELLEEILSNHPEVDYVQLQINYLDWENPAIASRRCYEVAVKYGKKVLVMEPVKGGSLATVPEEAAALLRELDPEASPASFAIRFAQSLPEVEVVLSGMNTPEQMADNMTLRPDLSDRERETLAQVAEIINRSCAIPCTGCRYCVSGCPRNIRIPDYFKLYNEYAQCPSVGWKVTPVYAHAAQGFGKASDCIECRSCERHCPQKIQITDWLKKVKEAFEE